MRELLRNAHFDVTVDDHANLVRRTRTEVRFETLEEIVTAYDALVATLDMLDRPRYAVLVDLRVSLSRNDPAYETTVEPYHVPLYRGFRANAVLVQTAAGRLQLARFIDGSRLNARLFTDEAEALAFLRG